MKNEISRGYAKCSLITIGSLGSEFEKEWDIIRELYEMPRMNIFHIDPNSPVTQNPFDSDFSIFVLDMDEPLAVKTLLESIPAMTEGVSLSVALALTGNHDLLKHNPFSEIDSLITIQKELDFANIVHDESEVTVLPQDYIPENGFITRSSLRHLVNMCLHLTMPILVGGHICMDFTDIRSVFLKKGLARYFYSSFDISEIDKYECPAELDRSKSVFVSTIFSESYISLRPLSIIAEKIAERIDLGTNIIFSGNSAPTKSLQVQVGVFQ